MLKLYFKFHRVKVITQQDSNVIVRYLDKFFCCYCLFLHCLKKRTNGDRSLSPFILTLLV